MSNKTQLLNHNERLASVIQTLQGKAAGGGGSGGGVETCTVTIGVGELTGSVFYTGISETGTSFNTITHKYNKTLTIENVMHNSILAIKYSTVEIITVSGDGALLECLHDGGSSFTGLVLCRSGNVTISFKTAGP